MKALIPVILLFSSGCTSDDSPLRMSLPKGLKEISGLAVYQNDLIAIADEKARIYRISFQQESVTRIGAFGDPAEKGDFEGIAVSGETVYAITSDGLLYSKMLSGTDEEYTRQDTGLGELCEIEGLDYWKGLLYVLCKTPYAEELQEHLSVLAWDPVNEERFVDGEIHIAWEDLSLPKKKLHPSGVVVTSDRVFIVAAKENLWVSVSPNDVSKARVGVLSKSHEQAEGLAIEGSATYIADEGKKRGNITRYPGVF